MPEGGPSIREAISSAMKSDSSGGSAIATDSGGSAPQSQAPAPAADTSGAPQVTPSTLGGSEIPMGQDIGVQGRGPTRDPSGKFQAKAPTDPAIKPAPGAPAPKSPDPAAPQGEAPAGPPILLPHGWAKEHNEVWSTLPRKTQEVIEKREKERTSALFQERSKYQAALKNFDALNQVLQPRAPQLAVGGGAPAVIGRLFALSDAAERDPTGFVQWFAKERGIDLASLAAGSSQQAPVDPTVKALQDQLARQGRVISELGNTFRGTAEARESESQNAMLQTIDRWSLEKEADGSLKRPYFERLETEVLTILPLITKEMPTASPTERLEAAYDRAVYLHPETREAVTKMAQAKRDAEENTKRVKATEAAKLAGVSIGGSTAPNAGRVPPKTVGAALRQAVAEAKGRAA